jgi:hydrogenase small subunit
VEDLKKHFDKELTKRQISRRGFLKLCGLMATTLALEKSQIGRIARALSTQMRPPVIWLEFQDCTGDTESFLRISNPSLDDLILNQISVDYHETLMTPAGDMTEVSLNNTMRDFYGQYIVVVEGSIPTANNGIFCMIRGRTALSILESVSAGAWGIIAAGSCAWDGGLAAAYPNPTGAVGVKDAVSNLTNLVNLPGCPANAVNIAAVLVHILTYNSLPARDGENRPTSMYQRRIHQDCERRVHYEADRYVRAWGDEGHLKGWCLEEMGCKGPETYNNCARIKWNDGTSWPIGSGHHCVGCSSSHFWDERTPFYEEEEHEGYDD